MRTNLRLGKIQYRVTVHNLSNIGAMAAGLCGLSIGQKVFLQLRARGWTEGRVRWVLEDRCGIEFNL
jgi:hypothetical protein